MIDTARPLAALTLLALAGCARDDTVYPSLAPRAAEQRGFGEPEAPPVAPPTADPALDTKLAALRTRLAEIVAGFDRSAAVARTAAGRPGARTVGAEGWLDAQTAIAQLDDWRAQASLLATDADALASARAATLAPRYPALDEVRTATAAEVARQDAAIGTLAASLPAA